LQPGGGGSGSGDPQRLRLAAEALANLLYLASKEVEKPERVRMYLKLAQERLDSINEVLRKNLQ
jgi:hypothetical protein